MSMCLFDNQGYVQLVRSTFPLTENDNAFIYIGVHFVLSVFSIPVAVFSFLFYFFASQPILTGG